MELEAFVPSPVVYETCGGSGQSTPRSALRNPIRHAALRDEEILAAIRFGSEEDSSEDDDPTRDPVYVTRSRRLFYEQFNGEDVVPRQMKQNRSCPYPRISQELLELHRQF